MIKNKIAITLLCVTTYIYTSNIDVQAFHMDKAKKRGFFGILFFGDITHWLSIFWRLKFIGRIWVAAI